MAARNAIAAGLILTLAFVHTPAYARSTLSPEAIYGTISHAQTCLSLAWNAAAQRLRGPAAPNCLRMAFHDAGTYSTATDDGGANGSVMLELAQPQHAGLDFCPAVITAVLQQVHSNGCPQLTAADAIQVAGAAAVSLLGGPACPLLMGRPDKGLADTAAGLPNHCDNANTEVGRFTTMGFRDPVKAVVVLSGAHNVGNSRATPRGPCSKGLGPLTDAPGSFDGHYYTEVVTNSGKRGWFDSDRHLNDQGAPTAPLMQTYSANHQAFLGDWCSQYQEMSLLGVNPAPFALTDGWAAAVSPTPGPGPNPNPNNGGNNGGNGGNGGGGNNGGGGGNGGNGGGGRNGGGGGSGGRGLME